jgi:two-component system, NtrC family, nitrogen regulation sensor histidine kinase NtrY
MKLRARFTVTLAMVALVPIVVATVVTHQVISRRMRTEYADNRAAAMQLLERELSQWRTVVSQATIALANQDHPLVGAVLRELVKGADAGLDGAAMRRLRDQSLPVLRGLGLDILIVTGPNDEVVVAPHMRAMIGEVEPRIRQMATKISGDRKDGVGKHSAWFAVEKLISVADHIESQRTSGSETSIDSVLMALSAGQAQDSGTRVSVVAGRRFPVDWLESVRRPNRIDARLLIGDRVVIASVSPWSSYDINEVMRLPLQDRTGTTVANIELWVSDGGLSQLLSNVTLAALILAALALALVVLTGTLVARRVTKDLDALVKGSVAAARGDLDFRVKVGSKDEIGAVANSFNFMMEDLQISKDRLLIAERIAAWQEIARRLAHEIKNPLTPIQMAMDTLRKTWRIKHASFDEILEESTTTVLQEADRLKRIVTEFSDFARMPKPEFSMLSLSELVEAGLALYQGSNAINLKLAQLPKIEADRGQLQQVLLNLVENARDAVAQRAASDDPGDGKIIVTTEVGQSRDRVILTVEDHGVGVPADVRDKVFAPYFSTKLSQGGTGLGLAIVHRIVSDHGGRISVSDVAGGGARFSIELPLQHGDSLLASRI